MIVHELPFHCNIPGKSICVPASPPADISAFEPVIDHPLFQKLRWRKQLGINCLVFPGAVHTRFEHAIGVLGWTQRFCQIQKIGGEARKYLCTYALLHDVGHGPFSHQIEPVLDDDHHERGGRQMQVMADALGACGIDVAGMERMFAGESPLVQLVSDRNLGTDKLDYLCRDALHIGFSGTPDIEKLQSYIVLDRDGVLAIEEKFTEDIKCVQKFYTYLHQHGYLNKTALSMQRIFQRAVQEELAEGLTDPDAFWDMTDEQLNSWLRRGRNALTRELAGRLDGRDFHRTALVVKPEGYGFVERRAVKGIEVREWSHERIRRFSERYCSCERLLALEDALAEVIGMGRGEVLFAAMPFFGKLIPKDVRIFSAREGGSFWLFKKDRDHYRSLTGDYLRTFAIRLIVPPEFRAKAASKADRIVQFLEEDLDGGDNRQSPSRSAQC